MTRRIPTTQQDLWLLAAIRAVDGETVACPKCDASTIEYQYIGYPETRMGFMHIWCSSCNHGTYLSRAKVPVGVEMLSMDEEPSVYRDRIPDYTWVNSTRRVKK